MQPLILVFSNVVMKLATLNSRTIVCSTSHSQETVHSWIYTYITYFKAWSHYPLCDGNRNANLLLPNQL